MSKIFDEVELGSMQWNRTAMLRSEENMPNLVDAEISQELIAQVKETLASR